MKLGLALPYHAEGVPVTTISQLARAAERLGYDTLWALEREVFPHAPNAQRAADATARDAARDPLGALAFAAGGTERVALGLSVANLAFHSPVALGTGLAALDRLSNGRVRLGLGAGHSARDSRVVASTLRQRTPSYEFVEALESLWSGNGEGYSGEYFYIPRGVSIPQPAQSAPPDVSLVGFAPAAVLAPAALLAADGAALEPPAPMTRDAMDAAIRGMIAEAATCPRHSDMAVRARIVATSVPLGPDRKMFHGNRAQIQTDIDIVRARGVSELIFDPGDLDGDADLVWALVAMQIVREMVGSAESAALLATA